MRLLARVGEEVDPPDRVHDAGRPDPAVTAGQRGRSLAGQLDAQRRVFRVKMLRQNVSVIAMISSKTGRIPVGTFGACPGPDMPPPTPRVRFGADLTATIR